MIATDSLWKPLCCVYTRESLFAQTGTDTSAAYKRWKLQRTFSPDFHIFTSSAYDVKAKKYKRQLYYTRDRWDAHVFLYDATIGTEREIFQLSTYNCTGCEPTPSAFAIMIIKASLSLSLSLPFFRKNRLKNHTGRRRSKSLNTWIIFSIKTVVYIIYACVLHMCVMMMYWLRPQSVTHSSRMNGATKKNVHWFLVFHHFSFYMSCFLCVCGWLATASHT